MSVENPINTIDFISEKVNNLLTFLEKYFEKVGKTEISNEIIKNISLMRDSNIRRMFIDGSLKPFWNNETREFNRAGFTQHTEKQQKEFIKSCMMSSSFATMDMDEFTTKMKQPPEVHDKIMDYFEMFCDLQYPKINIPL
jgi:hypothetical protein